MDKTYVSIYKWNEMGNFTTIETTKEAIDRLGMPSGFAYSRTDALDLHIKKLEAQRAEINLKINWIMEVVKKGII